MLQQQQQYATLNPLSSYKSALTGSSTSQQIHSKSTPLVSSMAKSISIVAAPSVQQRVDAKDEQFDEFMKEMEGLL